MGWGGSKMFKPITAPPRGVRLKSYPISLPHCLYEAGQNQGDSGGRNDNGGNDNELLIIALPQIPLQLLLQSLYLHKILIIFYASQKGGNKI